MPVVTRRGAKGAAAGGSTNAGESSSNAGEGSTNAVEGSANASSKVPEVKKRIKYELKVKGAPPTVEFDYPVPDYGRSKPPTNQVDMLVISNRKGHEGKLVLGNYPKQRGNPPILNRETGERMSHTDWSNAYNNANSVVYRNSNFSIERMQIERKAFRTRALAIRILIAKLILPEDYEDTDP